MGGGLAEIVFCVGFLIVYLADELLHFCCGEAIQHHHGSIDTLESESQPILHSHARETNVDHTKTSVVANLEKILDQLPDTVSLVHIHSDNATSQFKNKDIMASLDVLEKKHNVKIRWHFFAAMHGKGVVDGIGGAVKRVARRKILTEDSVIKNAEDFSKALRSSDVNVLWFSETEKANRNNLLNLKKTFTQSKKLKDISKCHYFYVIDGNVKFERLSP